MSDFHLSSGLLLSAAAGLLPVVCFLAALLYFDSYKLVRLRTVVAIVASGVLIGGASYFVNGVAIDALQMDLTTFTRYVSPATEEPLKGLVILVLVRAHRIGFLVDAAIFGFAVGTGFAVIENLFCLRLVSDAGVGTWIVRGFGTAIMHGFTAILAVLGLALKERMQRAELLGFIPGFGLTVLLHSAFNHLFLSPKLSSSRSSSCCRRCFSPSFSEAKER